MDTHFTGFQKLGAKFHYDPKKGIYKIDGSQLKGTYMLLDEALLPAPPILSWLQRWPKGRPRFTTQPVSLIYSICLMINSMGGKIKGIGSNLLDIEGVESLRALPTPFFQTDRNRLIYRTSSHDPIRNHH